MAEILIALEVGHLIAEAPAQAARLLLEIAQERHNDFDALGQEARMFWLAWIGVSNTSNGKG